MGVGERLRQIVTGLMETSNIFEHLPVDRQREHFETLHQRAGLKLERIISYGQTTPPGEWYDQDYDEWVLLLQGAAVLRIEGEQGVRSLVPGDYLLLPAHQRHRVEWTESEGETLWLALHDKLSPVA